MAVLAPCPIPNCPKFRQAAHVACAGHWGLVPAEMQKRVYASWGHAKKHRTEEAVKAHRALLREVYGYIIGLEKTS